MEELITLEQLKNYDVKKGTVITYVESLPTAPENRIYAMEHSYEDLYTVTKNPIDLVGSYFTLHSVGKYVCNSLYSIKYNTKIIGSIFISNSVVSLYSGKDFSGLYAETLDTSTSYKFEITETVNHKDYYAGDKESGNYVKLANVEQVDDFFIRKIEKGTPGGIAILDANGRIPTEELPTQALVYQGQWDASSGTYPANGTVIGDFYIVSVAGTVGETSFLVGDWIIWDGFNWTKSVNTNAVSSVAGKTGAVTLTKSDVGLGNVNNTSDANKPVSTATQTALDGKVDKSASTLKKFFSSANGTTQYISITFSDDTYGNILFESSYGCSCVITVDGKARLLGTGYKYGITGWYKSSDSKTYWLRVGGYRKYSVSVLGVSSNTTTVTISNVTATAPSDITFSETFEKSASTDDISVSSVAGKTGAVTLTKSDVGLGNVANSTYAGGTAVTLNGTGKGANTASFYAPTGAGTSGQYLKSNGSGAPTWTTLIWTGTQAQYDAIATKTNGVIYLVVES